MSRKKLRAAVVGVGYLGQFHAEKLAGLKDVELVAVADADAARAKHVAAKHGCAAFTDPGALLGAVDLVSIAVPTALHHRVALAFLDAGVHVLVEKPVTKTLEEADALLGAARAKGVLLAVGHLERFNPAFRALAQTFERPLYIECERLSGFKQRGIDVDVVLDLMIHDLDLARALARSEIGQVSACGFPVMTDAIDIANVRIEFANGCVANLSASRVSQTPVRKLRVFQYNLYASADLQIGRVRYVRRAEAAVEQSEESHEGSDPLRMQDQAFVAAVRGERSVAVTGEDGRRALDIALTIGRLVRERLHRYEATAA